MKFPSPFALCSLVISLLPVATGEEAEFVVGPDYTDAPETKDQDGVPKGEIHDFTMDSKDSRIYKGIAKDQKGKLPYQRKVAVYVPAGATGRRRKCRSSWCRTASATET